MTLLENNTKTILFSILCICFLFYLCLGIYSYKIDKKSNVNIRFFALCISASLWAIGYAFMIISPNIQVANIWRIFSALGWCFFCVLQVLLILSLASTNKKKLILKIYPVPYTISIIFFISNLIGPPSKMVSSEAYGFVDNLYSATPIGNVFSIYVTLLSLVGFVIIYYDMKNSHTNRVAKQFRIILITCLITFCIAATTDFIFPIIGISVFPSGIITLSISMCGMWYAINKYKMMSISYELVSEYIFEAVNEPIFIIGEDFVVKNCNKVTLALTGYNLKQLENNPLNKIIDFRNFNFYTIMQKGNVINIEVELKRKNKTPLVCELSATVIYDEYKDVLGILALLHDVSERKKMSELQVEYTLELEESNLKLKNEITDRLLAEEQIRHFIYYDALTEIFNRKKMLEDVETLLDYKNEKFAILFIDLDKFKSVNDDYGHQAGDTLLKNVALRLKNIIRSTDTIYRIGGDEFIIILRNIKEISNAETIATSALETLNTVFIYKENSLFIGASIGISIFPKDGIDADTLIKTADFAMYELKRKGRNGYKIYSSEMN